MTTRNGTFNLALNSFGLRFISPETESAYRFWRNERNLSVIRLSLAVSIPTWLSAPWLGYIWRSDIDWFSFWSIGYLLVVPAFAGSVLATYSRIRRYATLLGGVALTISGSTMLWIIVVSMSAIPGVESTGPAIAITVLMASFALFMRLPPIMAVVCIAPFMFTAGAWVVHLNHAGTLPGIHAYPYVVIPCVAYFFVGVMSVAEEHFVRRAFVNEQLLDQRTFSLEQSRNLIRRYVPSALVEQIIEGEQTGVETPQRLRVTVLFADIMGFTEIADRVDPEVLTQVIGEYMAAMTEIMEAFRGTVNEFTGDGLMALFGAPRALAGDEQARCAVRAAHAMHAKLPALNAGWRKLGLGAPLQIRIGINTGMASVGSFGSEGRMTYTAIGLQTNIAARIQSHCEPGGILLSDSTWQLVHDDIECESRGEVECKGVHFPVVVYSPKSRKNAALADA